MELMARNISHMLGGMPVLSDVSLHIHSGEIVSILGPSGCGKSTLLRVLGGLEVPSSGTVTTRGAPPPSTLNIIANIFQDFALVPWLTVEANVALPLEHHCLAVAEREERVASVLARLGLTGFATAYPKQLSGGMKQRTCIARAFAVNPAILLMDEPTSALDALTGELVLDDLMKLQNATGCTAVCVTHNLDEALRISNKIVLLSKRPGDVRKIEEIRVPTAERSDYHPDIVEARRAIKETLRHEAIGAEQDLVPHD